MDQKWLKNENVTLVKGNNETKGRKMNLVDLFQF